MSDYIKNIFNKIENEEKLTENELYNLLDFEIDRDPGVYTPFITADWSTEWKRTNTSIIEFNDNFYCLFWMEILNNSRVFEFKYQPFKIEKIETIKQTTIKITEYVFVDAGTKNIILDYIDEMRID